MSTFLLIIKILPWALSLGGGIYGFFTHKRTKFFKDKYDQHLKTIQDLKDIVVDQGEDLEKKSKIINEMLIIQKKYEKKKGKITGARSATKIMKSLKGE